jgi:CRP-like cAMP-binding protein
MSIRELVKGCNLFFEMYDEEVERVIRTQKVHVYTKGEYIIREGQKAEQIYILLEGLAELQKATPSSQLKVERFRQGEVFGLLMLLDEKPYNIDVVASTRCSVLEIKHRSIMNLFDRNPRIFAIMTLNICRILGKRLKNTHERIAEIRQGDKGDNSNSQAS